MKFQHGYRYNLHFFLLPKRRFRDTIVTMKEMILSIKSESPLEVAEKLAAKLRAQGKTVDIVMTEQSLKKKMRYASKIANNVIVIGEDEVRSRKFKMKNFETGEVAEI